MDSEAILSDLHRMIAEVSTALAETPRIIECPSCPPDAGWHFAAKRVIFVSPQAIAKLERRLHEGLALRSGPSTHEAMRRAFYGIEVERWRSRADHADLLLEGFGILPLNPTSFLREYYADWPPPGAQP